MRNPYAQPDSQVSSDFKSQYKGTTEDTKHSVPETGNENFDSILLEIRRLNDEILDEKVSNKIYEIEGYTKNIFAYVSEHPSAQAQIGTFMNYYLPTTLKLLESYSRIEKVGVAGENMKSSKQKIEDILDLLSTGYKQQLDQLFKNESIDISSDIKVLETMMQKDGLDGKNDFDISAFTDGYSDDVNGQGGAAAK